MGAITKKTVRRANEMLAYIEQYREQNFGSTPSYREIGEALGMTKGNVARYIGILKSEGLVEFGATNRTLVTMRSYEDSAENFIRAPIVGDIACGLPIFAEENIEEYVKLPVALFGRNEKFILRARGDSMTGAGIDDGDYVIVSVADTADPGQIVVALLENEATLKYYFPEEDGIHLRAANPAYEDIVTGNCAVQGVAVNVIKNLQ